MKKIEVVRRRRDLESGVMHLEKSKGYLIDFDNSLSVVRTSYGHYSILDIATGLAVVNYCISSYIGAIEKFQYDFTDGLEEKLNKYRKTEYYKKQVAELQKLKEMEL